MTIYVQLLSGTVYHYSAEFVLQLLLSLSTDLKISQHNIKLFHKGERVFSSDYTVDEETYHALIEEDTTIIDRLDARVIEGDYVFIRTEPQRLFATAFEVHVAVQEFTPQVIETMKQDLWEYTGEDTRDLTLSELITQYVTKVRMMTVYRILQE